MQRLRRPASSGERRRVPVVVDLSRDVVRAEPFGRERTAVNMDGCDRRARIRLDERWLVSSRPVGCEASVHG